MKERERDKRERDTERELPGNKDKLNYEDAQHHEVDTGETGADRCVTYHGILKQIFSFTHTPDGVK